VKSVIERSCLRWTHLEFKSSGANLLKWSHTRTITAFRSYNPSSPTFGHWHFQISKSFYEQITNRSLYSIPGLCVTKFQVCSQSQKCKARQYKYKMQKMVFERLDYGLLNKVYFLKIVSFQMEIKMLLMTFCIETQFSAMHHRLEQIKRRKSDQ
jgi:hypothetical protein